jgi:hypothetical protein
MPIPQLPVSLPGEVVLDAIAGNVSGFRHALASEDYLSLAL